MIGQAFTNLIKNAGEAIESYQEKQKPKASSPKSASCFHADDSEAVIRIMPTTAPACRPTARACSSPMSPPAKRARALACPSSRRSSRNTAARSPCSTPRLRRQRPSRRHGRNPPAARLPQTPAHPHPIESRPPRRRPRHEHSHRRRRTGHPRTDRRHPARRRLTTRLAANSDDCMAEINADPPALMILDIWLKDSRMDGIDILKTVKRDNPDIPVVIISGHGNIEIAVAAIKQGAYDFIEKPFNIDQLMVVVARAMETSRLRRENQELRRRDVTSSTWSARRAFKTLKAEPRQGDQVERPRHADRRAGLRQGNGRALYPHALQPALGALHHRLLRLDRARADGRGAVRPRNPRPRGRARPSGTGPRRHRLFRRGRRHAAWAPRARSCAC
jgi:ActR/RegA family two-component response regulator